MSYAFVQAASAIHESGSVSTLPVSLGTSVSGDLIYVAVSAADSGTPTVTDSLSTSYTLIGSVEHDTTNGRMSAVFYGYPTSSGANAVTLNLSTASAFCRVAASEYSGVSGAPVASNAVLNASATTAANNATTGAVTPTATGQLVISAINVNDVAAVYTAGTSPNAFALRTQDTSTDGSRLGIEDCAAPSTSALTPTWTLSVAAPSDVTGFSDVFALASVPAPSITAQFAQSYGG